MVKKLIISISCALVLCIMSVTLAENKNCQNEADNYCINVDVTNSQKLNNINNDLCYVLQINASNQFVSGSFPLSRLPAAVFAISKKQATSGKPLIFKMIKAEIVPSGQCSLNQFSLKPVDQCEVFEYATLAGVSRSILLKESRKTASFTCDITN